MGGVDEQLLILRRQYLQLLDPDFLSLPPNQLLQNADAQQWIYRNLFSPDNNPHLPSERYQFRVLKDLISRIERAIEDPDEHVGQDIAEHLMAGVVYASVLSYRVIVVDSF